MRVRGAEYPDADWWFGVIIYAIGLGCIGYFSGSWMVALGVFLVAWSHNIEHH